MASWRLLNTVQSGTQKFFAGMPLDDAKEAALKTSIESAGGLFLPASDAVIDAAGAAAEIARSRGANEAVVDAIMATGLAKSKQTADSSDAALLGLAAIPGLTATQVQAATAELVARVLGPAASETAIKAIAAATRADGQLVVDKTKDMPWLFDAASTAAASAWALVPDAGTGRWLRNMLSVLDLAAVFSLGVLGTGSLHARGVVTANVASLAAFTVASNDGLTYAEGERVLLVGQTTAAQCAIYVCGAVGGGTCALTLAPEWASGKAIVNGAVVQVSEGTLWAGSEWKAMCTGAKVVATDDPLFYPRVVKRTITLATGTLTLGAGGDAVATPIFSTTKSTVAFMLNTPDTVTLTTSYCAPVASRVAGKAGTGAVLVRANVAAGSINVADLSTLDITITNW